MFTKVKRFQFDENQDGVNKKKIVAQISAFNHGVFSFSERSYSRGYSKVVSALYSNVNIYVQDHIGIKLLWNHWFFMDAVTLRTAEWLVNVRPHVVV